MIRQINVVNSVNDTPLVSMLKDSDGPTFWSKGPRNKYDPKSTLLTGISLCRNMLL